MTRQYVDFEEKNFMAYSVEYLKLTPYAAYAENPIYVELFS